MCEAGITQPDALHPLHLWPVDRGRVASSLKATRNRFERGRKFYGNSGNVVTINDIPPNSRVILHCGPKTKLKLLVN